MIDLVDRELSSEDEASETLEEGPECQLCLHPIIPRDFHSCTCTYEVCPYCWYRIYLSQRPTCPACRHYYINQRTMAQVNETLIPKVEAARITNRISFELLQLISFFDSKFEIPTTTFHRKRLSQDAVLYLVQQEIVRIAHTNPERFHVPKSVQTIVRRFVDTGKVLDMCKKYLTVALTPTKTNTVEVTKEVAEAHIPHAIRVWKHILKYERRYLSNSSAEFFATLCDELNKLTLYQSLLALTQVAVPLMSACFQFNNTELLKVKGCHGKALFSMGRADEAFNVLDSIQGIIKDSFGTANPLYIRTTNEICSILNAKGKTQEACKSSSELYGMCCRQLGEDQPETLWIGRNYALLLSNNQEFIESLKVFKEVYSRQKRLFGRLSQEIFSTQNWIGFVLDKAGKLNEASIVYEDLFLKNQELTGQDRNEDSLLRSAISYCIVLNRMKDSEKCLEVYAKQMELLRTFTTPNKKAVLLEFTNNVLRLKMEKAKAFFNREQFKEAEKLFEMGYRIRLEILGENDQGTQNALNNLRMCRKGMTLHSSNISSTSSN